QRCGARPPPPPPRPALSAGDEPGGRPSDRPRCPLSAGAAALDRPPARGEETRPRAASVTRDLLGRSRGPGPGMSSMDEMGGVVTRYVALLRAVNVGGRRVAMPELRRLAEELGYEQVSTHINSGNLLLS